MRPQSMFNACIYLQGLDEDEAFLAINHCDELYRAKVDDDRPTIPPPEDHP